MDQSLESIASREPLRIAYITAGGAGMFCGCCMRDNTVARVMHQLGHDVHLIPMYTPIRVDEEDVSEQTIFYGGINVYMEQTIPGYSFLPSFLTKFFDQQWLIKWATSRGIKTDARQLGALTLSMLRGVKGNQRNEAKRLATWLEDSIHPQVINLSNMLIAGCAPHLKERLDVPIVVTLQGDDIFMDELPEPYRAKCFQEIRNLVPYIDKFITFSRYYADYMSEYFGIPRDNFEIVPLGIDLGDFAEDHNVPAPLTDRPPTIGYLARMVPEKGLHLLVDAFIHLKTLPGMERTQLKLAGWAGKQQETFVQEQMGKLQNAGIRDQVDYLGTVNRVEKLEFLRSIDLLSVPTIYKEPKGIFVLEALACGVPVIQPEHGAFPELLEATTGGHLIPPNDHVALGNKLAECLRDLETARLAGQRARTIVRSQFSSKVAAEQTLQVYDRVIQTKQNV